MRVTLVGLSAAACVGLVAAKGNEGKEQKHLPICPIKGRQFPSPVRLSKEKALDTATQSITAYLDAHAPEAPFNQTTFSLGVFSADAADLVYEYHHTDASVAHSPRGAAKVDGDSIYRVASVTKILTVYLWILTQGHRRFNDPISDHIPELLLVPSDGKRNYAVPAWSEITVGDLAMYLAGVARDYGLNDVALKGYVTSLLPGKDQSIAALPDEFIKGDIPTCGYFTTEKSYQTCSREVYINGTRKLAASFPSAYTPSYSNANFALLGIALDNILQSQALGSIEDVFEKVLVQRLGLTGTTYSNPKNVTHRSVIPGGDEQRTGWNNELGLLSPAAGAFSTIKDFAAIGRSILNNTLMEKVLTRRWFSTNSFVENTEQGVGLGWQIFRRRVDGHTVDLYTKDGYWGIYTSFFALIPEYGIGFTLLTASTNATGKVRNLLSNKLTNTLLPALSSIARSQAHANFAGTYHASDSNSNTSITITTDTSPGLRVTQYTSHGVDLLANVFAAFGTAVDFRLVPNQLYPVARGEVGFTGVYQGQIVEDEGKKGEGEEWYGPCQTWLDIDDFTYGNVPLGQMVFEVGADGSAVGVELKALGQKLKRKGSG